jgi:nuclear pore complex protein Nup133
MEYLFFATEQLIQDRTRDLGSVIDERPTEGGDDRLHREQVKQERLKDQMTYIGASLCINMEDRVRFASTYVSPYFRNDADEIDKLMVI